MGEIEIPPLPQSRPTMPPHRYVTSDGLEVIVTVAVPAVVYGFAVIGFVLGTWIAGGCP